MIGCAGGRRLVRGSLRRGLGVGEACSLGGRSLRRAVDVAVGVGCSLVDRILAVRNSVVLVRA